MPVYQYKCRKCEGEFEFRQGINDSPLEKCVLENGDGHSCGGEVFRKISKNVGLVFNGSGFYQTDYTDYGKSAKPAEKSTPAPACACGNDEATCNN